MSDKLCVYGAKVHIFSDIYKKCIYIIFLKCFLLRFPSLIPSPILPTDDRENTERRATYQKWKNRTIFKILFLCFFLYFFGVKTKEKPKKNQGTI